MFKKLFPLVATAFLALSLAPCAQAVATLKLTGTSIFGTTTRTVVDNGTGDLDNTPGSITFSGSVGTAWSLSFTAGSTKPAVGSAVQPTFELHTTSLSISAGTLTIEFSEDSFGPAGGTAIARIGGRLAGGMGSTFQYKTLVSNANAQFAGTELTNLGPFTQPSVSELSFSGTTSAPLNLPASFAVTQRLVLVHKAAGSSGCDASLDFAGTIGNFVWNDLNRNGIQENGEPGIDGVTVNLRDFNNNSVIRSTVTAANGFYQFTQLPPGPYYVSVDTSTGSLPGMLRSPVAAPGSTAANDSNPDPAQVVLTSTAPSDQTIDFGFYGKPLGQIGDRIWLDLNQNGIQDDPADEPGIEGVIVTLKDGDGNVVGMPITTDANGNYLFTQLFAGDYTVTAMTPAGLIPTIEQAGSDPAKDSNGSPAPINLPTNTSVDLTIDFGYIPAPAGSIGDYIWRDLNGDGIQGSYTDEPPIPNVPVELLKGSTVIATTTTDSDGLYQFTNLSAGTYSVRVPISLILEGFTYELTTPGSDPMATNDSNPNPSPVTLPLNTSRDSSIDFGYAPLPQGRIGNFVWNDVNGNGLQDSGEPGIGGVTVRLLDSSDNDAKPALITDATGAYLFEGLAAGSYKVFVDTNSPANSSALAGFYASPTNVGTNTAIDSNDNPSEVTLPSNISSDLDQDFGFLKPTGKIGDFVWKDLNQDGIQQTGEPGIAGVTVKLLNSTQTTVIATTTTSASGAYCFTGLSAGTYSVAILNSQPALAGLTPTDPNAAGSTTANDSDKNPTTVTLATHTSVDLTIDFGYIPVSGAIGDFVWKDLNGNGIQDVGEPGLAGVAVCLYKSSVTPLATATTDSNGSYLFEGLSAGTYYVYVDPVQTALVGYTATTVNALGSTTATDSNANPATVSLATNTSKDVTIDFGFVPPPSGRIGDFVWHDLNRNGIQDAAEPGINGVTVKLYSSANVLLATQVTSGNGGYLFTGLKTGTYTVVVDGASPALAGFSPTTSMAAGSTPTNDSNGSPATVTLPTHLSSNLTIDFGYKLPPSVFTTYTMGGWGACPSGNNPGTLLLKNFSKVYPKGLKIGGKYTLTFTSQLGIQNFLPCGTTPRALTKSYINPTSDLGTLAGQVTALRLNVDFSNAGILPTGLKNAQFVSGPFAGKTVGYVLTLAESVVGGGTLPAGITYSTLNAACALVNQNYDGGLNYGLMTP